jgi:branched-chain amino acid transport system permease protein
VQLFVTSIVTGLFLGGTFALIALGFVLVFRATRIFNFAHGEAMLLGAYFVGKYSSTGSVGKFIGYLAVASLLVAACSVIFYVLVLRRLGSDSLFIAVIATFGFGYLLDGAMGIVFQSQQYVIDNPLLPSGATDIFGAKVQSATVVLAIFSLGLGVVAALVLQMTQLGVRVRAAGQSELLSSMGGINVRRIFIASWAVAGALAALAGVAYGSTNVVGSSLVDTANLALPAMMLGGLDSFAGAVVGGVVIGLLQGFITTYVSGDAVDAITYGVLLVVLLVRPSGLFGTKVVTRV